MNADYDLLIIGGGINGAGIARDAAGRGLSVLLAESGDLAGATSSASTKLIHGGLRYLEYYEFSLVRHALLERERLLRIAPHLVQPLTFVLPHEKHLRPKWMISLGLLLYDNLAPRRALPRSRRVNLQKHAYGEPLRRELTAGFTYADCRVDDARMVVLNAMDAAERGATILPRVACTSLRPENGLWRATLRDTGRMGERAVTARMAVNATGPWVRQFLDDNRLAHEKTPQIRLVKGSHIVTKKLFSGPQAYILQQPDGRIVFAIPYEHDFTLIGTTDTDYSGDPRAPLLDDGERAYLLAAMNRSFTHALTEADIVHAYSGVRPLLADGHASAKAVTRDYRLVLDDSFGPRLLSVFGGKITTFRRLAEEALALLTGEEKSWTASAPLPGAPEDFDDYFAQLAARHRFLPPELLLRYAHAYGTRTERLLEGRSALAHMGEDYGAGLYDAEIAYLVENEWARTPEDILWRRTKRGLHIRNEAAYKLTASRLLRE
jgi:glycerol-3-phosphate dehydrogenase